MEAIKMLDWEAQSQIIQLQHIPAPKAQRGQNDRKSQRITVCCDTVFPSNVQATPMKPHQNNCFNMR